MKSLIAFLWKRRWCRLFGIGLILGALPLLHPFIRQSIFGPTIHGIPWCVWEEDARMATDHDRKEPWFQKKLQDIGLAKQRDIVGVNLNSRAALPLCLHLADDGDVKVRRFALGKLRDWVPEYESETLAILRRHLQDDDPQCQLIAAEGFLRGAKDDEMKSIVLPLLELGDPWIHRRAAFLLNAMAADDAELFGPLAQLAEDPDVHVRCNAVDSMRHFGARGVPILRKALDDPAKHVRQNALDATLALGKDAEPLIPLLLKMRDDPDADFRRNVANGLYIMDPKRFEKPAWWTD